MDSYQLSGSCKIPLSKQDKEKAKNLLKKPWIAENKSWRLVKKEKKDKGLTVKREQLEGMIEKGYKAEIQSVCSKNLRFLTDTYLPTKLPKYCL